jgi:hypothetical protein
MVSLIQRTAPRALPSGEGFELGRHFYRDYLSLFPLLEG